MNIAFSIITVTYNSRNNLLKTILSVQSQNYKNYQHIIKDGLSTDETKKIDFSSFKNTKFFESKDIGIYDAMNQAFKYAQNEYIIYLNSGDVFFSENTLYELARNIAINPNYNEYIGGTLQINPLSKKLLRIIGLSKLYRFLPLSQLPHPSFVVKKSILKKLKFPFDPYLNIASDYKQQLTLRKKNLWKIFHLKQIISIMPIGGKSNINKSSVILGYKETLKTSSKLFPFYSTYIIFLKLFFHLYSKILTYKFKKIKIKY